MRVSGPWRRRRCWRSLNRRNPVRRPSESVSRRERPKGSSTNRRHMSPVRPQISQLALLLRRRGRLLFFHLLRVGLLLVWRKRLGDRHPGGLLVRECADHGEGGLLLLGSRQPTGCRQRQRFQDLLVGL